MTDFAQLQPSPREPGQPGLVTQLQGFQISDEVEQVAVLLVNRHPRLRFVEDFAIGYLLHHTDPPAETGVHKLGAARLTPKHARPYSSVDATVAVNAPVWTVLSERQREALVLHELLHLGQNEKTGELELVPHDVEEFGFVAATYGQWSPALRDFAEQLQMGLEAGQP